MAKVSKREWTYKGEKKTAWIVRYFDQSGARRQETFEKKKDADACRLRIENQLRNGTHVATSQTCTVADLGRLFLEDCERRQKIKDRMTRTTLRNYYILVEQHVVAQFGAKLLTDLSYDDAQNWLNESCTTMTRHTVVARYKMLSVMLKFAVRKKLVGRNVIVEGGVRVPDAERRRISIPSLADLKAVLVALDDRAPHERRHCFVNRRAVVGLALFNGLRRGEIAGLRWENVDLDAGTFSVKHSRSFYDGLKSPKTFAGNREQVFVPYVAEAVRQLHEMQGRPTEGYVVLNQRGKPICVGSLYMLWSNLARKAGFADADGKPQWRFHDFRHSAASLLISEGVTPLHVAAFMGHSSVNTTLGVYGHLFPEDTRVAKAFTEIAGRMLPAARLTHEPATH